MLELWALENEIYDGGVRSICGVDEAGRGPLAGPVCAAAVVLPRGAIIEGLNDSKKLSEKRREALFDEICDKALEYSIAFASVEEIEELNILNATFLAMNRAISGLGTAPELALIDGNQTRGIDFPCRSVVGGDGKCADIAAASILAKVSRDRVMREMDRLYPGYGFAVHKGYEAALCRHPRAGRHTDTPHELPAEDALMAGREIGSWGEERAAQYLRRRGYKILARNYSCRGGEIDVIASRGKYVAFVEVKLRKSAAFAEAREFVTRAKQQRIIMTAELWLGETGCELQPRFDVVEIYAPDGESGRISIEHIADAFRCD
jgi:ribonuclease HII